MAYVEVDVDVDDLYDEMSSFEKQSMAERLEKDGFCTVDEDDNEDDNEDDFVIEDPNAFDEEWVKVMKKLFNGRLQLSLEDEETITKIANKL